MTAAEKTATIAGGSIAGGASKSGTGFVQGTYTVTLVTSGDWVILSDFTEVYHAFATTDSDGTQVKCVIDSSTTNKVTIAGTGATTLTVVGTPATA